MTFRKMVLFNGFLATLLILLGGTVLSGCYADGDPIDVKISGSPKTFTQVGDAITLKVSFVISYDTSSPNLDIEGPLEFCTNWVNAYRTTDSCGMTYFITEEDVDAGKVINRVTGRAEQSAIYGNSRSVQDSATLTITLEEITSIELAKTATPNWYNGAGEEITYTYTVENTGNVSLTGPVTITDDLVEVDCPEGDLEWGESMECVVSYTTTEEDAAAMQVKNTATASADGVTSNEASFVVYLEVSPELTLTKTAKPNVFSQADQFITYTFELENTGNVPISPPFEISDPRLEDWSCPHVALGPGEKLTCTGIYYTRHGDVGATLKNCATVFGVYQNGQITSNEACAEVIYQKPEKPEKKPSPCEIDPDSRDCFCEKYPHDC
jgi:hypothetical protein